MAVATGSADVAVGHRHRRVRSAFRPRSAGLSATSRPSDGSRPPASSRCPSPSTMSASSRPSVGLVSTADDRFGPSGHRSGHSRRSGPPASHFGTSRARPCAGSEPAVAQCGRGGARAARPGALSVVEVELPSIDEVVEVTNTIMFFEAAQHYGPLAADPAAGSATTCGRGSRPGWRIAAGRLCPGPCAGAGRCQRRDPGSWPVDAVVEPTVPICAPTPRGFAGARLPVGRAHAARQSDRASRDLVPLPTLGAAGGAAADRASVR